MLRCFDNEEDGEHVVDAKQKHSSRVYMHHFLPGIPKMNEERVA